VFVCALNIENFKRIVGTVVPLAPITVVVGGNNSGKSCVLQAPHFAVNLLQATLVESDRTIPAQNLRYLPTGDILDLPHGERLTTETAPVRVTFELKDSWEASESRSYSVEFTRGEGLNVRIKSSADEVAETLLSDYVRPFSIYVPGLAGIPLREEYRSDALIASAIARGDANLYLRNVLLRISRVEEKLGRLNRYLDRVLPGAELTVQFDETNESYIRVWVNREGRETPLDAMGTGILQFLQILAYVIQYQPSLILLDEPDAHLHPNNQRVIASLLQDIVREGGTQIVLATHSRTLLDSFRDIEEAAFVWLESGEVQKEASQELIEMLMALGALDGGERFYSKDCTAVFLTEDTHLEYIHSLLEANGIDPKQTLIHSYETSSRLQAAIELAKFIKNLKPAVRVIVHRDRDFMTDDDLKRLEAMYLKDGADIDLFVPEGCDVEHYFTRPEHIAASFEMEAAKAQALVDQALEANKVELVIRYAYKLDELKWMYQKWGAEPPKNKDVIKGRLLQREHALGKLLLGKIIEMAQGVVGNPKKRLLQPRDTLIDEKLRAIATRIPKEAVDKEHVNG
jgi:predicted ATPase